ncbi:MAG: hypothetical protein LBV08_04155 [Clostridiales bacterium]|jgi:uncharacterized protein YerC|nr:hypothetical protein [Clostridiales bacterium]
MGLKDDNLSGFEAEQEQIIQEFLNTIHGDIKQQNKVFFSILQIRGKQIINRYYMDIDKAVDWVMHSDPGEVDTYYSVNQFNCPKRQSQYVFRYTSFFFDIDKHKGFNENLIKHSVNEFISYLAFYVKNGLILLPNIILYSGKGVHLLYLLDKPLPKKHMAWLHERINNHFAKILEVMLQDMNTDLGLEFELDNCYKDESRVLRLPATMNTKVNRLSEIIYSNNYKYSIEKIRDFFNVPEKKEPAGAPIEEQRKPRVVFINRHLNLHNDRLSDLLLLIELRFYNISGKRELFLFLVRYYHSFVDINTNYEFISRINNKLTEPLPESELKYTESAEKAYYQWLLENKSGYNYYNKTLIKLLGITEEEQTQLKTIISKDEKNRRMKLKNWKHDKRASESKKLKDDMNQKIEDMLTKNKTYDEITRSLKVSKQRVSKIEAGKTKETINNRIKEMLLSNCTYRQIIKELKVSVQRISKIKKMC